MTRRFPVDLQVDDVRRTGMRHMHTIIRAPGDAGAPGDGSISFQGRAVVYDQPVTLLDSPKMGLKITESISRGAFTDVLAEDPDVHLLWGHDLQLALARTGIDGVGGLRIAEDDDGVVASARLDPDDPDVQRLVPKMRNGVIDQMSFWARIGGEDRVENEDEEGNLSVHYEIRSFTELIDVTVTARGVYNTTNAELRSADLALLRSRDPHASAGGAAGPHADESAGGDTTARARALESLRADARVARRRHRKR